MGPVIVGSPSPPWPASVDGAAGGLAAAVVAGAEAGYKELHVELETEGGGSVATEVSPPG